MSLDTLVLDARSVSPEPLSKHTDPDGQVSPRPTTARRLEQAAQSFHAERLVEAERICTELLDQAPDDLGARRQLGLIRLVGGDPAAALSLLRPLQGSLPDDADLAIAVAEAEWALTGAAAALPHYRRAIALVPGRARVRARFGLALLIAGYPGMARQELEAATRAEPDGLSLTHLGMALLADSRALDAVPVLQRATQFDPADPASALQLGLALRDLGHMEDALLALAEAVRRGPSQAHLHVALGDALFAHGDYVESKAALLQATALDPAQPLAWAKLGDMEQLAGDMAAAVACYRKAAALDDNPDLLALLGNALLAAGDPAGKLALGRSMQAAWAAPTRHSTLRVGILAAPSNANTPTSFIVDRTRFAVSPVFMLAGFDYACGQIADSYDVLFNAVSDPDAAPQALALATRLTSAIDLPVANPPNAIYATTREQMAARLSGIAGLHVPQTIRCERDTLRDLAVDGPVLVRAVGSHGGKDLTSDVREAAATLTSDEAYVTPFVDFRSPDGLYRKLRIVFVDGQPFPVHLAIGDHWLSHYFRTAMADNAAWRAEEAAFLTGPEAYLGRDTCRALQEVQDRVGLDFFGIDGAIGPDGRFVIFECNAAMLVRHTDRPSMFDYKRAPAERVRAAVSDMLHRLATGAELASHRAQRPLAPAVRSHRS